MSSFSNSVTSALTCLIDALSDPARRHATMLKLAAAYAFVWGLYAIIAKSSQGLNADMAEMVVWGQNLALGYPKHPPLLGWIPGAWFAVFPRADWAFYILSAINLGAGLYLCFVLAGEWLDGTKRALVPFLLALIPFHNFLGLKFDQNSFLIPLWALTAWAFVRSLETRHLGYAALAGAGAAAAMLTKYWSGFMVLALILAAPVDDRRRAYFRSAAPWVSALVGAILLAPHVAWLFGANFPPGQWIAKRQLDGSLAASWRSTWKYVLGTVGYASVAIGMFIAFARPSVAAWRDILLPRDNFRRVAAILLWAPFIVPILVAWPMRINLLSVWNTPLFNALPIVLLASPLVTVTRDAAARVAGTAITIALGALLLSPVIAGVILKRGVENHASYARDVAMNLEAAWRREVKTPLRIVAGPFPLVSTMSFYLSDRPKTFADFSDYLSPWVDQESIVQQGIGIVCPSDDTLCRNDLEKIAGQVPATRRSEITVTPHWLWLTGEPLKFIIAIVPPRG